LYREEELSELMGVFAEAEEEEEGDEGDDEDAAAPPPVAGDWAKACW
jgi:hypothetical protein